MKYFFVITGPSACGKTTLLQRGEEKKFWKTADKVSTRDKRKGVEFDDIVTMSKDEIDSQKDLDYRYIMNDNIYAFSSIKIVMMLDGRQGSPATNVAIVCSDLGTIRKLKEDIHLKDRLVVLFISTVPATKQVTKAYLKRAADDAREAKDSLIKDIDDTTIYRFRQESDFDEINILIHELQNTIKANYSFEDSNHSFQLFSEKLQTLYEHYVELMPSSNSYKRRIRNIDKFYYKYVEEIGFFDYTILNFFDPTSEGITISSEKMTKQVANIIKHIQENEENAPAKRKRTGKALFFICAPKRSGKAILFSNLNLMSKDSIEIVRKIALREDKNSISEIKKGKGDGFRLSETYWMFDSKNDDDFIFLEHAKQVAGEEKNWNNNEDLNEKVKNLLLKANERVNLLIDKRILELNGSQKNTQDKIILQKREHKFDEWFWHFQGNYYAVDTCAIFDERKHSIVISNMDQLEEAKKWAEKAGKLFIPIFLVYVDFFENSKRYHEKHDSINGENTNIKIFETINDYYEKIGHFCHVILNNGIAEDVHDQISNIIGLYEKNC